MGVAKRMREITSASTFAVLLVICSTATIPETSTQPDVPTQPPHSNINSNSNNNSTTTTDTTTTTTSPLPAIKHHYIIDTAPLDINQDGCISGKAELDAFKNHVMSVLTGWSNPLLRAHSIVYRTDVNRDGRICWCDFISIYLHDKATKNKFSLPYNVLPDNTMFIQLDTDRDGKLQGNERENLVKEFASCIPREPAESIVATMANFLDKDDSISVEEFQQFMRTPQDTLIALKPHPETGSSQETP